MMLKIKHLLVIILLGISFPLSGEEKGRNCAQSLKRLISKNHVLQYASKLHKGQVRKFSGKPYISHPIAVAKIVEELTDDKDLIFAAYLHDTLEDTSATYNMLNKRFGSRVADLVKELTTIKEDKESFDSKALYLADKMKKMSKEALLIKLADRLHNTSDFEDADIKFITKYRAETNYILAEIAQRQDLDYAHKLLIDRIYQSMSKGESLYFAKSFAKESYAGLLRNTTGEEYIIHPTRVAKVLERLGANLDVQTAAYLKDVVEKSTLKYPLSKIKELFGPTVKRLVYEISTPDYVQQDFKKLLQFEKTRISAISPDARLILLVSRFDNLREIKRLRKSSEYEKYIASIDAMVQGLLDHRKMLTDVELKIFNQLNSLLKINN